MARTAVVLFNLGGPDGPDSVGPFLRNLFSDPAILRVPGPIRFFLSRYISRRRTPVAKEIYARIGGSSPLLAQTREQAEKLEREIGDPETRVFVCMRYWHPRSGEVAENVREFAPERVVLLPLYPQFSTSTTESSFSDWSRAASLAGIDVETVRVCCYPAATGFVRALAGKVREGLARCSHPHNRRVIFSAHGVPESFIEAGDPYQFQVELTVAAVMDELGEVGIDYVIAYQSRVGRRPWLKPYTDEEILRAGRDGAALVVVPVAFVSEHSETLVELDMEYADLARAAGVPEYVRVDTVGIDPDFIEGLSALVRAALDRGVPVTAAGAKRICPDGHSACPNLSALS